jgi:hypothetical protein
MASDPARFLRCRAPFRRRGVLRNRLRGGHSMTRLRLLSLARSGFPVSQEGSLAEVLSPRRRRSKADLMRRLFRRLISESPESKKNVLATEFWNCAGDGVSDWLS